jgi:hypothetical protein
MMAAEYVRTISLGRASSFASAAGELPTPPAFLPRPRLMVFGGDEIYPYAKEGGYESQVELPYRMGLDDDAEPDGATLLAIPGNHDHYESDGNHVLCGQVGIVELEGSTDRRRARC